MRHVFNWTREALLAPLDPGRGGYRLQRRRTGGSYSGAKATILFMTGFAVENPTVRSSASDSFRHCQGSTRAQLWDTRRLPHMPSAKEFSSTVSFSASIPH